MAAVTVAVPPLGPTYLPPYSQIQLDRALGVLRAEKAGILEPANESKRIQKLGLRSRNHDDTLALDMLVDDWEDDSDEDFDPREEGREWARELNRRRAALRNANDSVDADAEASEGGADEDSADRNGALNISFKFNMPMAKWVLRSLDEDTASAEALPAFLSNAPFQLTPSAGFETAAPAETVGQDAATGLVDKTDAMEVDGQNYRLESTDAVPTLTETAPDRGRIDKKARRIPRARRNLWKTISRPIESIPRHKSSFFVLPDDGANNSDTPASKPSSFTPITSDPRLVDILRLGSVDFAAHHSSHCNGSGAGVSSAMLAAIAIDAGEEAGESAEPEPETTAEWLTDEAMRSAQAKYAIIPNLVSVKTRRPRWMKGAARG